MYVRQGQGMMTGKCPDPHGGEVKCMADKRMFNKKIIESDAFLYLSHSAQILYFHLNLCADDDGFLNNVSGIMAQTKTGQKELDELIEAGFILHVSKFVYVITHWFLHNNLKSDRFKPTICQLEKSLLVRPGNVWAFAEGVDPYTEEKPKKETKPKEPEKKKYGEYQNVLLTDEEYAKLQKEFSDADSRIEELSGAIAQYGYKYSSHYATIRNWGKRKDKEKAGQKSFGDIADGYEEPPTWDIDL